MDYKAPSIDMRFCDNVAEFMVWETGDVACGTDTGVPCGSELPSRNGIRGWEVCGVCLKDYPAVIAALKVGAK